MITCCTCRLSLDHIEFSVNKTRSNGYSSNCKTCAAKYSSEYRNLNKENLKISKKIYADSHKDEIKAYSQTLNGKFTTYKSNAGKDHKTFHLTKEEFTTFWQKPCSYCGSEIATVGIDRVNSLIGYEIDNCVPCCETCNRMKLNLDKDKWIQKMISIISYLKAQGKA